MRSRVLNMSVGNRSYFALYRRRLFTQAETPHTSATAVRVTRTENEAIAADAWGPAHVQIAASSPVPWLGVFETCPETPQAFCHMGQAVSNERQARSQANRDQVMAMFSIASYTFHYALPHKCSSCRSVWSRQSSSMTTLRQFV